MSKKSRYYVLEAGLIFMISICSLMLGMTHKQGRMLKTQLHEHAASIFDIIVITRRWNAMYSGVFVTKGPGVVSNPYLKNPDISDENGVIYTQKNPALMTREISEIANSKNSYTFHITSLNSINPGNAPDSWETEALEDFERGIPEKIGTVTKNKELLYRFMRPIYVEKSCLKCHGEQGYKIGQVRGGISINIPFSTTLKAIKRNSMIMISLLAALLGIFAVTLYLFVWKVMDKLEKQKIRLEELNQTKNKFLGMCAHDLRNPLTSIMGFSELLSCNNVVENNENLNKSIKIIQSSSLRMLNIVNNFLDISVIESGKLELQLTKGPIKPIIEEYIETCTVLADKKDIKIKKLLNNTSDMYFDKYRISQILDNIIGNAVKYSPQGSVIHIELNEVNNFIEISIKDEGPGIEKQDMRNLFKEYHRLKAQPTGGEKSAGLGLAITKKIVDYHKGKIKVESSPGKGSTFILIFPKAS